jgi:hypothetical protein
MNEFNACFISYRHTGDPEAHKFVQCFVKILKKQLAFCLPNVPIYFDEDGSKVGDFYNEEIAYQLCRSACMVMFFSLCHFDLGHPYCAFEYKAMLDLEQRRLGETEKDLRNKGLIFPIVFRGLEYLPSEIAGSRHYENFDHIVTELDFEQRDCQAKIKNLCYEICKRYIGLWNAGVLHNHDCKEFRFPNKDDIMPWIEAVAPLKLSMPGR